MQHAISDTSTRGVSCEKSRGTPRSGHGEDRQVRLEYIYEKREVRFQFTCWEKVQFTYWQRVSGVNEDECGTNILDLGASTHDSVSDSRTQRCSNEPVLARKSDGPGSPAPRSSVGGFCRPRRGVLVTRRRSGTLQRHCRAEGRLEWFGRHESPLRRSGRRRGSRAQFDTESKL